MAKKAKHEDHINHEAWAIPYGDLITLLLAFFVVMYSMSSVNEGKYRVLSDSLNEAFGGAPRSPSPVQIGPKANGSGASAPKPAVLPGARPYPEIRGSAISLQRPQIAGVVQAKLTGEEAKAHVAQVREARQLEKMADEVHEALGDLIAKDMVIVRRHETWLEVEIQTDILFASGSAHIGLDAAAVLDRLAEVLKPFDNHLRIEGHTDNRPIATREFPSNWELSSARAATVVHRFMGQGVDPRRMTVTGLSEYQPVADNADESGRNRNRRVVIVVLANPAGTSLPPFPTQASTESESPLAALPDVSAGTIAALAEHAQP